jgi:hypothetical protein
MTDTDKSESGDEERDYVATQGDPLLSEDEETAVKEVPYMYFRHILTNKMIKVYFRPERAQFAGRNPKSDIYLGDDGQISDVHFLVISLGSGFKILDVSSRGTFLIDPEKTRTKLKKFCGGKPPFPEGCGPTNQDMSRTLKVGDIIQLGNGGSGVGPFGEATVRPYTKAEFEIVAGEGECGGKHGGKKRRHKDISENDDEHERDDEHESGRASAVRPREAEQQRKAARVQVQQNRWAKAQATIAKGHKGKGKRSSSGRPGNHVINTAEKRALKEMMNHVFTVRNRSGKGKGGKGKGRRWS